MKNRSILMWALAILVIFFIFSKTTSMYSASNCPYGYPNYNNENHDCWGNTISQVADYACPDFYMKTSANVAKCVTSGKCKVGTITGPDC